MSLPASERPASSPHATRIGLWLDRTLGLVAAVILFTVMMLTTVDVISRYLFNWPLRGAFELTELGLLSLIFAGLPMTSRRGEHVTMDFIDALLSLRVRARLIRTMEFIVGLIVLGLAWQIWLKANKIANYGDTTDVLKWPIAPFVYFMTVMVAITGLVHLGRAVAQADPPVAAAFDPDKVSST
jgi:TRAP-type transport system small permease protein